jgi:hypothetical protein
VAELREHGAKPVFINTYLTCINASRKWCALDWKINPLKPGAENPSDVQRGAYQAACKLEAHRV